MGNEIKTVNGKLILNEKKFNRIVDKVVMKNNESSGKINKLLEDYLIKKQSKEKENE